MHIAGQFFLTAIRYMPGQAKCSNALEEFDKPCSDIKRNRAWSSIFEQGCFSAKEIHGHCWVAKSSSTWFFACSMISDACCAYRDLIRLY